MSLKDKVENTLKAYKRKEANKVIAFVLLLCGAWLLNMLFGAFVLSKLLTWFVMPVGVAAALGIKLVVYYLLRRVAKQKEDEDVQYVRPEDYLMSILGKNVGMNVLALIIGFVISLFV